jgi:hypothetical protein
VTRIAASVFLLVCTLAHADVDARFAKLRDSADPVGGLGQFLDKYVGDCGPDALGGSECKQNAAGFRRSNTGKKFYMIITEDAASMISMGGFSPGSNEVTLNVVPIFAASNSAVTQGAPSRLDKNDNPVLPLMYVKGTAPGDADGQTIGRWVSMRALRIQLVFTPQGLWELKKKDGSKVSGVRAKIDGMLISVGRSGEPVGLYLAR